jgi:predicted lipid carrier protein YhbT
MAKACFLDLNQCNHDRPDYDDSVFLPGKKGEFFMFAPLRWPPRAPLAAALNKLPHTLGGAVRLLPFAMQRPWILFVLQQVLHEHIQRGDLDFLSGRQLQVWISDADIRLTFGMQQRLLMLSQSREADTIIRGKLSDFILLASRSEDPDTLFFQRRLVIEGNTDLGLEMKNVLDTLDSDSLPARLQAALTWLAQQYQQPGEVIKAV